MFARRSRTTGVSITYCVWQSKAVNATYTPAQGGKTIVDHNAHADLRTFLAALKSGP